MPDIFDQVLNQDRPIEPLPETQPGAAAFNNVVATMAYSPHLPAPERIHYLLQNQAVQGKTYDEMVPAFKEAFGPDADPAPVKNTYDSLREHAYYRDKTPHFFDYLTLRSAPFASSLGTFGMELEYKDAKARTAAGTPRGPERTAVGTGHDSDAKVIARYERLQELQAEQEKTTGGAVRSGLAHVPAVAGEYWLTGGIANAARALPAAARVAEASPRLAKVLGITAKVAPEAGAEAAAETPSLWSLAGLRNIGTKEGAKTLAAQGGGAFARNQVQTTAAPSTYLPEAGKLANQQGGEWSDAKNLGKAYTVASVQNAVYAKIGPVGNAVPGKGFAPEFGRFGTRVGVGLATQQVLDVLHGVADKDAGYGAVGDLLKGNADEATKKFVVQLATFAAFSSMHIGQVPPERPGPPDRRPTLLDEPPPTQERKLPPDEKPQDRSTPTDKPPPPGGPLFEKFTDALKFMQKKRIKQHVAVRIFTDFRDQLIDLEARKPNLTEADAVNLFKGQDDGPIKDFAEELARAYHRVPATDPGEPPAGAKPATPAPVPEAPPADAQVTNPQLPAGRPPEAAPPAPAPVEPSAPPAPAAPKTAVDLWGDVPAADQKSLAKQLGLSPAGLAKLLPKRPDLQAVVRAYHDQVLGGKPPEPPPAAAPPEPVEPAPAKAAKPESVTLSTRKIDRHYDPEQGRVVAFNVHDYFDQDGKRLGDARIVERDGGKNVHVEWVGMEGARAGSLKDVIGSRNAKSLLKQLAEQYPDAETVSGVRTKLGLGIERQTDKLDLDRFRNQNSPRMQVKRLNRSLRTTGEVDPKIENPAYKPGWDLVNEVYQDMPLAERIDRFVDAAADHAKHFGDALAHHFDKPYTPKPGLAARRPKPGPPEPSRGGSPIPLPGRVESRPVDARPNVDPTAGMLPFQKRAWLAEQRAKNLPGRVAPPPAAAGKAPEVVHADLGQRLSAAFDAKKLTAKQKHVLLERAVAGRAGPDIAADPALAAGGKPVSKQAVAQLEARALARLGKGGESVRSLIHAKDLAAGRAAHAAASKGNVEYVAADPPKKRKRLLSAAERRLRQLELIGKRLDEGKISNDDARRLLAKLGGEELPDAPEAPPAAPAQDRPPAAPPGPAPALPGPAPAGGGPAEGPAGPGQAVVQGPPGPAGQAPAAAAAAPAGPGTALAPRLSVADAMALSRQWADKQTGDLSRRKHESASDWVQRLVTKPVQGESEDDFHRRRGVVRKNAVLIEKERDRLRAEVAKAERRVEKAAETKGKSLVDMIVGKTSKSGITVDDEFKKQFRVQSLKELTANHPHLRRPGLFKQSGGLGIDVVAQQLQSDGYLPADGDPAPELARRLLAREEHTHFEDPLAADRHTRHLMKQHLELLDDPREFLKLAMHPEPPPAFAEDAADVTDIHGGSVDFDFGANESVLPNRRAHEGKLALRVDGLREVLGLGLSAKGIAAKWLMAAGNLPPEVFKMAIAKDGQIGAYVEDIRNANTDLRTALGGTYNSMPSAAVEWVNKALEGDPTALASLPAAVQTQVAHMRGLIDSLASALIRTGAVTGPLAVKVDANLGLYLHRAYRVFSDPAWYKKVDPQVRNNFQGWLRAERQALGLATDQAKLDAVTNALLMDGTAADNPIAFLSSRGLGDKDLSILMKRGEPHETLRALWGEVKDPIANFTESAYRQAHLLVNHAFQQDVIRAGAGKFLFDEPTGDAIYKLAEKGDQSMGALAGKYTTKEVRDAFDEMYSPAVNGPLVKLYLKAMAVTKHAKTVLNPLGHERNILGNLHFVVANGHWRLGHAWAALEAFTRDTPASRAAFRRMVELGVVGDGVHEGALKKQVADTFALREYSQELRAGTLSDKNLAYRLGRLAKVAGRLYRAEDGVFKAFAFLNEVARYREAFPNTPVREVEQMAADNVRETYPSESMVPKWVKASRNFPLTGDFPSFTYETIRASYATIKLAAKELRRPETRAIGATRLAGFLLAAGFTVATGMLTRWAANVTAEEDSAMRRYMPEWNRNSTLWHLGRGSDGHPLYIDTSTTDPNGYFGKVVLAAFEGDTAKDKALGAATEAGKPFFFEESMLTARILDALRNKRGDTGRPLYNEMAPTGQKWQAVGEHVGEPFVPGAVETGVKTEMRVAAGKPPERELTQLGGQRVIDLDVAKGLVFKTKDYVERLGQAHALVSRVIKQPGPVSDADLASAYRDAEAAHRKLFDAMAKDVAAAKLLGVDDRAIKTTLHENGLSANDVTGLMGGRYVPYRPKLEKGDSPETVKRKALVAGLAK